MNGLIMINGLWVDRPYFYESRLEYLNRVSAQCTCDNRPHASNCRIVAVERAWSEDLNAQYADWKAKDREREDHNEQVRD